MLRFIRLISQGVSLARNLGARVSTAPWFATLDDDTVPGSGWAQNAIQICSDVPNDVGIIQGRIDPLWLETPPQRISKLWLRFLSIRQRSDDGDITAMPIYGAGNMLVNKRVWLEVGGYDNSLGPFGNNLASGEDEDLVERIIESGFKLYYSNSIAVLHRIHRERLTKEWIVQRLLMEGKIQAAKKRNSVGKLLLMLKLFVAVPYLHVLSRMFPDEDDLFIRKRIDISMLHSLLSKLFRPSANT